MKSPAFQFYPAEYMSDENVVLMTNQERGCYVTLMCFCWREGSIPKDIAKIAKLCGESEVAMAQLWLAINPCFEISNADPLRLVHPRLERERSKQTAHNAERSESGKKGAQKRWNKNVISENKTIDGDSKSHSLAIAKPIAEPMANDGFSSSSSSSYTPIIPKGDENGTSEKQKPDPPDPLKTKTPLMLRAEKLLHRRQTTPWTAGEQAAWRRNLPAIESTPPEDWNALEAFYAAPQRETFSRKDFSTLVNNWNGEIDRAKAWKNQRKYPGENLLTPQKNYRGEGMLTP